MELKPLGGRVVVEPLEQSERIEGGIHLPETASEAPTEGTVVAVGPGELLESGARAEMPVSEGDHVLYGKYAGTEITIQGKDVKILNATDILAVRG